MREHTHFYGNPIAVEGRQLTSLKAWNIWGMLSAIIKFIICKHWYTYIQILLLARLIASIFSPFNLGLRKQEFIWNCYELLLICQKFTTHKIWPKLTTRPNSSTTTTHSVPYHPAVDGDYILLGYRRSGKNVQAINFSRLTGWRGGERQHSDKQFMILVGSPTGRDLLAVVSLN